MDTAMAIPIADTWGMHGDDVGIGWWVVMMIGMVLFWGAIILGIVWLVRGSGHGWGSAARGTPTETPLAILERRFAEGAISAEDYWERREVLTNEPRRGKGDGE